jgi:hypothetical protein
MGLSTNDEIVVSSPDLNGATSAQSKYFKDHVKRIKLLTTTNWLDYLLYRRTKNGFHNFCCYVFIIKAVKISLIFTDSRSNNSIYVQLLLILQYAFIC